jgi:hypothetical protein
MDGRSNRSRLLLGGMRIPPKRLLFRSSGVISFVMAIAAIPKGFNRVASVHENNGSVEIVAESGEKISTQKDLTFLQEPQNQPQ